MKNKKFSFATFLILSVVAVCFFLLKKNEGAKPGPVIQIKNDKMPPEALTKERSITNTTSNARNNLTNINGATIQVDPVSRFETLDDLKQIKTLQMIDKYGGIQEWCSDGHEVTFEIKGHDGRLANLPANFVGALANSTNGHIIQLDLHTPELDIDQVRKIGVELNDAWGLDSTSFIAWCEKVGNTWVDAPLFSSGAGVPPSEKQLIGYGIYRTLNDEKPWSLKLVIQDK